MILLAHAWAGVRLYYRDITSRKALVDYSCAEGAQEDRRIDPLVNHPALVGWDLCFNLLDGCFGSILPNRHRISLCCKGLQLGLFCFNC